MCAAMFWIALSGVYSYIMLGRDKKNSANSAESYQFVFFALVSISMHTYIDRNSITKKPSERQVRLHRVLFVGIGTAATKGRVSAPTRKQQQRRTTHSRQAKLRYDTPPSPTLYTPILHRRGPRVPPEGVELQLRLVAHLGRERLVPRDEEIRSPDDLFVLHALAGFYVPEDADVFPEFWHCGGR